MHARWLVVLGVSVASLFFGCGIGDGSEDPAKPDDNVFESDVPGSGSGYGGGSSDAGAGAGGATSSGGSGGAAGAGGNDAEKAIEEADIIQLKGTRLYALSRYGGLSVIDVSVKDQLKLLGRHEIEGEPFEMYVRDDVVLAMYSSYGHYVGSGNNWEWVQSSAVIALDAKNPAAISEVGEFFVPGEISDSRIVGDVLYAVSYENGYCWSCRPEESTTVISLDVKLPSKVFKVDELAFTTPNNQYGWGKRSISVTQNRMYVAGREYGSSGQQTGSTIQIVDISDPTGKLVKGASVSAAGMIESRWQMDEKDGVLRLISQPGNWSMTDPPVVQTFTVASSSSITPLGSLPMVLPEPERLRSVRFDGDRAYAITFRQTDPLFVIDLSNPATPQQVGELEMPGWVYHMEPRGDRLLALGFDQGNTEGALNVSIFDVADMTQPKMLDRINFGGDWGQFAEDQDRIHKAFTILDTLGVIFVPFSGWSYSNKGYYGCGTWVSGIQLVDFTKDDLTKRGVAPSRGTARRAFLHDERLFAVSDVAVETFDIENRDKPVAKANLALANIVSKTVVAGDKVARLGSDWYTSRTVLDVVPMSKLDEPAQNAVDLEGALGSPSESECWYGHWTAYNTQLFANGNFVYVVAGYDERRIAVFDISSGAPVLQGKLSIPGKSSNSYYGYYGSYYSDGMVSGGQGVVQVGGTLVLQQVVNKGDYQNPEVESFVHVVDTSDPKSPKYTTTTLPGLLGVSGLEVAGKLVVTSHWAPSPTNPGKVRFYLDRFDVSQPGATKLLPPINIPGSLLSIDAAAQRAFSVAYQKVIDKSLDPSECYSKWGQLAQFEWNEDYTGGLCVGFKRTLFLVNIAGTSASVLDQLALADGEYLGPAALGDDRVFLPTGCYYCGGETQTEIMVLSGLAAGKITSSKVAVPKTGMYGYVNQVLAQGKRAVAIGGYPISVALIDATNPAAPTAKSVFTSESDAYYYYGMEGVTWVGDTLILARGQFGVDLIDLAP